MSQTRLFHYRSTQAAIYPFHNEHLCHCPPITSNNESLREIHTILHYIIRSEIGKSRYEYVIFWVQYTPINIIEYLQWK